MILLLLFLVFPHTVLATCCATLQLLVSSPVTTTAIVTVINSVVSRSPQRLYKVSVFFNSEYPSVSLPTTKMTANFVRLADSNGWDCTSVDSELFITNFELNHPFPTATGVQVTPNIQSFGQSCPIMPSCPSSFAALNAGTEAASSSDGLVDLGPLGKRPVWLAILLAVITAAVVLATLYAMWRRAYPNNPVPATATIAHFQEKRTDPFVPLRDTPSVGEWKRPVAEETRIQIYQDDGGGAFASDGGDVERTLKHSKSAKSLRSAPLVRQTDSLVTRSQSLHASSKATSNRTPIEAVPPLPLLPQFAAAAAAAATDSSDETATSFSTARKSVKATKSCSNRDRELRRNKSSRSLASSSLHNRPLIELRKQKSLVDLQEKPMIPSSAKVILKKQKSLRARTRPSSPATEDEEAEHAFTRLVASKSLKHPHYKRRSRSIDAGLGSRADASLAEVIRSNKKAAKTSANASFETAASEVVELGEYTPPPGSDDSDSEHHPRRSSPRTARRRD